MQKRLFALTLGLALTVGNVPAATAAATPAPEDGGLHVRVLPVMAGALAGGFVSVIAVQILFPGLAAVAGTTPFLQPAVVGRALVGMGIGAWVGDRYFP